MKLRHIGLIVGILFLGGTSLAQEKPAAPADLSVIVKILKDPAATDAQRERLVGKVYAGEVTVFAVRISATDPSAALIDVQAIDATAPNAGPVHLRFEARSEDPKVQQLQRNQSVRVRGTLKSFSGTGAVRVPVFSDLTIDAR